MQEQFSYFAVSKYRLAEKGVRSWARNAVSREPIKIYFGYFGLKWVQKSGHFCTDFGIISFKRMNPSKI
jgi:hypothetical protein